ncbi:MAG: tRNA (adenosine(37)-N6)-threonylcarbamoyltransferase complex ATPase subunit type 1 TsaE [Candidatus Omnitrophica bacterium]|nr:tRNA (adenosine(37)-N6)-threonylcarbamoyltransferase complex ATPase subunit type 1 TsaE [Candidatus Omnitrophota bacterium]
MINKYFITKNRRETMRLGEKLAKNLKPGQVVALVGELGSGKTTLVKGIAKGLGVRNPRYVNSPSFVIIKEYQGRTTLYHFDVFRLSSASDLDSVGYGEYFYGNGICVVEWANKIKKLLPKKYFEIKIMILGDTKRKIVISN